MLVHGAPHDDGTMLLETMDPAGTCERPLAEVEALLDGIDAPLILCGHSHTPRLRRARRTAGACSTPAASGCRPTATPGRRRGRSARAARTRATCCCTARTGAGGRSSASSPTRGTRRSPAAEAAGRADWAGPLATGLAVRARAPALAAAARRARAAASGIELGDDARVAGERVADLEAPGLKARGIELERSRLTRLHARRRAAHAARACATASSSAAASPALLAIDGAMARVAAHRLPALGPRRGRAARSRT